MTSVPVPPVRHRDDARDLLAYVSWQQTRPVVRLIDAAGAPVWLVTRHPDVRRLLTDRRLSADMSRAGFPMGTAAEPPERIAFIRMDGERHRTIRHAAVPEFRARAQAERDEVLVEDVRAAVRTMLRAPHRRADLVTALAVPLPALVIARTLGIPTFRIEEFGRLAHELYLGVEPGRPETFARRSATFDDLRALIRLVIAEVRQDPTSTGLIPTMLHAADEGGISEQDVENSAVIMLVAGHDATSSMIALSTLVLLLHPHHAARLREGAEQAGPVVEELLRFLSVTQKIISRVLLEDITLHGQVMHAGEGVLLLNGAANHDVTLFPDPFTFRPDRDRLGEHLAFGHGRHGCIGQNLARRVITLVLTELVDQAPTMRLECEPASLDYASATAVTSLHSLPVSW